MATARKQQALKKLFDESMGNGGLNVFRKRCEQLFGVHYVEKTIRDSDGVFAGHRFEQTFKPDERIENHNDWSVGEAMYAICGPNWRDALESKHAAANSRFEGTGSAVMAGDTPYVSAGLDVVAGLLNARALERAQHPAWIWDKMCTVEEATSEGGFHIGSRLEPSAVGSGTGTDLADGQMPPTGKVIATRIHRNRSLRQRHRMKVNLWSIKFDQTSQIMETVDEYSVKALQERERKVADTLLGVSAGSTTLASGQQIGIPGLPVPMSQDGISFFPYQNGVYNSNAGAAQASPENGAYVANFANAADGNGVGLTNYQCIANALQLLHANRDPFTKLPVSLDFNRMQFLVAPAIAATQLKVLLQQQALWQIAWGSALPSSISAATVSNFNLIEAMNLEIVESQYWMNRLVDAGLLTVAADGTKTQKKLTNNSGDSYNTPGSIMSTFFMGHFRKALTYWQLQPYSTVQVPLSSTEVGEETVLVQDHCERGMPFWKDTHQVYRQFA